MACCRLEIERGYRYKGVNGGSIEDTPSDVCYSELYDKLAMEEWSEMRSIEEEFRRI